MERGTTVSDRLLKKWLVSEAPGPPSFYRKLVLKLKQQASAQKPPTIETAGLFKFMERIFKV